MPNFGAGSGRMAKEVLGAFDSGMDWNEQQAVRKRAAAIDTENLRGATLRNNEQEKATGRTDDKHPGDLERQALDNLYQRGAITKQQYVNAKLGRTEAIEVEHFDKAKEAAGVRLDSLMATDRATSQTAQGSADATDARNAAIVQTAPGLADATDATSAATQATAASGAVADISKNRMIAQESAVAAQVSKDGEKTRQLEKPARDRIAELQVKIDEAGKEQERIDQQFTVKGKAVANPAALQELEVKAAQKALIGFLAQHSYDPDGTPSRLNDNKMVDIDGVVRTDIIDGVFRAYDKNDQIVMDKSGDEPSPVEWRIADLNNEMIKQFYPATWQRTTEDIKSLNAQKVAGARNAAAVDPRKAVAAMNGLTDDVKKMALAYTKANYDNTTYSDGSIDFSPNELREFEELTSRVMQYDASQVPIAQAWKHETDFPDMKAELESLGADVEAVYKELDAAVSDRRTRGADVTRMSMLQGLIDQLREKAQSQGAPPAGRIRQSTSPSVQQTP